MRSDVPTLFLAGAFDKRTIPENIQATAAGFSRGYVFVYPESTYSVISQSACGTQMFLNFLANPDQAPDDACIKATKVEFDYTPAAPLPLKQIEPLDTLKRLDSTQSP